MFKLTVTTTITLALGLLTQAPAIAWEQHSLPTSFNQSSTAHYGGNKAPLVLSASHIKAAVPNASGMFVWESINDGIDWAATQVATNSQATITQAFLATESLMLGWSHETSPTMYQLSAITNSWSATSHVWPLANWNIIHVSTSTNGDLIVLATSPSSGNLVEGELYIIFGNDNGWSNPARISAQGALVGDAATVEHTTGLKSIVWSQRNNNNWEVLTRHSNDGQSWSPSTVVVQNIYAPFFQEAAVKIAADALNHEEVAIAFTGWNMAAHSQVWSKAFDAVTSLTTHEKTLLPDAGDMVVQPSLVTLGSNTWAVAWQQTIGIDSEIFVAQHEADGSWTNAVNVSVDPNHMDRDPHIALGSSHTLNVAFTRRMQADVQEVYMFAEGDIHDASLDSDGDGIANTQEQGFDLDNDGIDDAQSARIATWSNEDGRYALVVEGNGELRQVQAPAFTETNYEAPHNYQVSGSLFSFQIHALTVGESTQVHLMTPNALSDDITWLKLNPSAQWSDSERENVYLDANQAGLIINLTDGGSGDEDGMSNGVIVDPAVLATPKASDLAAPVNTAENSQSTAGEVGGCVLPTPDNTPWQLAIMFILLASITRASKQIKI